VKEAYLYERKEDGNVKCLLCNHYCRIKEGKRGVCRVRICSGGKLVTLVYDHIIAIHGDPIEKKPFFHFLPGSTSLSIATVGCNFHCDFCQNHAISQYPRYSDQIPGDALSPDEIVTAALLRGHKSISYTYTEPTVFFELAYDTGVLAREKGLRNNFVSNGYMSKEAVERAVDFLDAANIDLKSFSDEFYQTYCGAKLQPVLNSIQQLKQAGVQLEITTLIIPDLNSSPKELRQIADFIVSVDSSIPWHVSAFHPDYKMHDRRRTSPPLLENAYDVGKEAGLKYIYCGNVPGHPLENTRCPECDAVLIERRGFSVFSNKLSKPFCPACGSRIEILLE